MGQGKLERRSLNFESNTDSKEEKNVQVEDKIINNSSEDLKIHAKTKGREKSFILRTMTLEKVQIFV